RVCIAHVFDARVPEAHVLDARISEAHVFDAPVPEIQFSRSTPTISPGPTTTFLSRIAWRTTAPHPPERPACALGPALRRAPADPGDPEGSRKTAPKEELAKGLLMEETRTRCTRVEGARQITAQVTDA